MTTRRYAPISALLAFTLLCLMPTVLLARTRRVAKPSHVRAKTSVASSRTASSRTHPQLRMVREKHTVAPLHRRRIVQQTTHRKTSRRGTQTVAVSTTRSRTRHRATTLRQAVARERQPATIPAPLVIKARVAPESIESEIKETGVSHPPDLDDIGPAASSATGSEPVVNIVRKSGENPQLPDVREEAMTPEILPSLYNKRGRLVVPPPLRGSREILLHQNEIAERDGLERIEDDNELESMRRQKRLVPLPVNAGMQVDERLPMNRRYSRPWTAQFLATLARAHYARFHTPLQINSAVRTVEFQQRLIRINGNAAPARGETASPHLTGQAVDIGKRGLSLTEIAWMRGYLLPLVQEGKIDVEEEFQQACFHISVYRKYLPPASVPRRSIASTHRDSQASLAVAIP